MDSRDLVRNGYNSSVKQFCVLIQSGNALHHMWEVKAGVDNSTREIEWANQTNYLE